MRAWGQEAAAVHTWAKQEARNCPQFSLAVSRTPCYCVREAQRMRLQIITSCSTTSLAFMYSTISVKINSSFTSPRSSFSDVYSEMPPDWVCSDFNTAMTAEICSLRTTRSRWCLRLSFRSTMKRKKWSRSPWASRNSLNSLIQQLHVLKQLRVQKKLRTKLSSVAYMRFFEKIRPNFSNTYSCRRHGFDLFFTALHPPSAKNLQKSPKTSSITCWMSAISIFSALSAPTKHRYWQT